MFDARELWRQGLRLSYSTELRPERADAVARLVDEALDYYYEHVTCIGMKCVRFDVWPVAGDQTGRYHAAIPRWICHIISLAWNIRKVQGKTLNIARLLKGLFTFQSGRDYIPWMIERHSGIKAEAPARLQRHPWLATALILGKLYRRKAYR